MTLITAIASLSQYPSSSATGLPYQVTAGWRR